MTGNVIFDPILPIAILMFFAALAAVVLGFAIWRGLAGWWLRGLAALVLLLALANPSLQQEDRAPLSDIVVVVVDESASQSISDRGDQIAQALADLTAQIEARPNTVLRLVTVRDADLANSTDGGTQLMTALSEVLAEEPRARIAGVLILTDGRLHDLDRMPDVPAPVHALITGRTGDWDRRVVVKNAPAFAILGEEVVLTLMVEDQGAAPFEGFAEISISIDGDRPLVFQAPIGREMDLPIQLPHGGMNVLQFSTPLAEGELTDRNNQAVVQINGVRDRLRVLLVSGEPHPGERTWRNLLKSDSSVDLVHFTILRPPEKQDGVPVSELSLIAFPTRELFLDKIDEFDLIIFDRYKRRGILPALYFESIRGYVENGGAVLIAAGPDFAGAASLYRSPLADILPGRPTARVFEEGFQPQITDLGDRHPVTEGLSGFAPRPATEDDIGWGRWFRMVDVEPVSGDAVMSGVNERPLLLLDRVGEGRVALLGSDHAWLWSRGYEGGGPQLELLRRLAHWMMKEPDLEEEALSAQASGNEMRILRRSLGDEVGDVTIVRPDGETAIVTLDEISPGRLEGRYTAPQIGLYALSEGDQETILAVGPAAPREFEQTIATGELLNPMTELMRGGNVMLEDGTPRLRNVRAGRPAAGRGWIGLTPRDAFVTTDVTVNSLVPAWLLLLVSALLVIGAWLREGRR